MPCSCFPRNRKSGPSRSLNSNWWAAIVPRLAQCHSKLRLALLAVLVGAAVHCAPANPLHRWSFNNPAGAAPAGTVIMDSISGAHGVMVGFGANFTGTGLTIPGTTTGNQSPGTIAAYVDLPNGLISTKINLTVEIWATVVSTRNWQRLFDFGKMNIAGQGGGAETGEITPTAGVAPGGTSSTDNLMLAVNRGTSANTQRIAGRSGGASELGVDSNTTINNGVEYHFVAVVQDGVGTSGANGSQARWYLNGVLIQTLNMNFRLSAIADVNNWLGRSQWSGDSQANISYNEFRLYDRALTPAEILASRNAGPNATFPPPTTQPDGAVVNYQHKIRIPVLANDSNYAPTTVEIVTPPTFGSATPDSAGRILYAHTTGTPATDTFTYRVSGAGEFSAPTLVTVSFTTDLRLTNSTLNVPATPPPTQYQLANAFPNLLFSQPLCLRAPSGETNRLFICEKTGLLRVIPNLAAAPGASTFLNLPSLAAGRGETFLTSSEQGLLGLAFHPGYATNGFFYVFYSVATNSMSYQRVSRFTVSANPNAANPASEVILFQQQHSADNHNAGDLHFGPDGYLYISLGDGGGGDDTQGHSQKINDGFFAAIARIDVDRRAENLEPNPSVAQYAVVPLYDGLAAYKIPSDNPYIGATSFNGGAVNPATVRTELYAVGLRNPWRMSFDPVTGLLYCADVGQNAGTSFEEINLIVNGGNYGWAFLHGTNAGPRFNQRPPGFTQNDPLHAYPTSASSEFGRAVTGGVVYRGTRISALHGAYVFSDFISGNVWALRHTNTTVAVERIAGMAGLAGFGTDPATGDVLAANLNNGQIVRLTAGTPAGSYPLQLSDTGVFADVSDLSPAPGVVNYEPNLPFWSDYAEKRRWFIIPDATDQMTWSRDGLWSFPPGQIWVKHFDLELERGNPATKRRLETRLLVRNSDGVYGVSYQWNTNQTDATLVPDEGVAFDLVVTNLSLSHTQRWQIPSRAECLACHTPQGGGALSFTTRQLNRSAPMGNLTGNQLELLHTHGYFANPPEPANTLPRHVAASDTTQPLELRARSYLEVNCASCHQPGGSGGGNWDARAHVPLFQTGLINGEANNSGGNPDNKLVVPRDPTHSILLSRVAASNGFTRMPPLATSELDHDSIALLAAWIGSYDTNRISFSDWQVLHFGATNHPNAGPDQDPDLDLRLNRFEYYFGSSPLAANPEAAIALEVSPAGLATVSYSLSPNAVAQVQTSTNLLDWFWWNVPGNDGLPRLTNPQTTQGHATNNEAFFRLRLNEH